MMDTIGISGDRIRSFIERIEHIDEEIKGLNEGKKEALAEAKGEGFDVKVLREILRLRKRDREDREEHESLVRPLSEGHGERRHAGREGGIKRWDGTRIAAQACLARNAAIGRRAGQQGLPWKARCPARSGRSHSAALGPRRKRGLAVRESLLGLDYCAISASSACASAISGISGVGEKPSSASARTAWASVARAVGW
jgi:uncharacterized protein (UPF0335 family)